MVSLGTLEIGLRLNKTAFDRDYKAVQSKTKNMEFRITPIVDHDELEKLNKHLDEKEKHFKQVQQLYAQGIKVGASGLGGDIAGQIESEIVHGLESGLDAVGQKLESTIEGLLQGALKAGLSPATSLWTGLFEGFGINISNQLSKGIGKTFKNKTNINLDSIGEQFGDVLVKALNKLDKEGRFSVEINDDDPPDGGGGVKKKSNPSPDDGGKGGGLAIARKDEERPLVKFTMAAQSAAREVDKVAVAISKTAKGIEKATLGLVPGANTAKSVIANTAVPAGLALGAAHLVPGGETVLHGIQGLTQAGVAPIANAISGQVISAITPMISAVTGNLPLIGGQLTANLTGAVSSAVPAIVGGATSALALGGSTIVAGKALSSGVDAAKNKLIGKTSKSALALPSSVDNLEENAELATKAAFKRIKQIEQGIVATTRQFQKSSKAMKEVFRLISQAERGKQLSSQDIKFIAGTVEKGRYLASEVIRSYERGYQEIQDAPLPKEQRGRGSGFANAKANLTKSKNKAQSFLDMTERFLRNPQSEIDRQIYDAITVDAVEVGKETSKGVQKGSGQDARKTGQKIGKDVIEGAKDSLGIQSPSTVFIWIRKQIDAGLAKGKNFKDIIKNELKGIKQEATKIIHPNPKTNTPKQIAQFSDKWFDNFFFQFGETFRKRALNSQSVQEGRIIGQEVFNMLLSGATMASPTTIAGFAGVLPFATALLPTTIAIGGAANMITPFFRGGAQKITEVERFDSRLNALTGNEQSSAKEMEYLTGLADKYKVSLSSLVDNYTQLAQASKNTRLEGDGVKELFEGITASIKAMRLNTYDSSLVLNAYTQILAKGKVSMEELRQQLGEKFPPAMDIFAKALGVSKAEFNTLVSKGALLSEDVLPKVARVLNSDFKDAALNSADDFTSAMARMESAGFEFSRNFTNTFSGIYKFVTNVGANILNFVNNNFGFLTTLGGALTIGTTAQIAVGLTQMFSMGKLGEIQTKITSFTISAFKQGLKTATPFLIGILADALDDIFGTQYSVFDNMAQGVTNLFVAPIKAFDDFKRGLSGDGLFSVNWEAEQSGMNALMNAFGNFFKSIPSGVIELTALVLMFEQVTVLGKLYLMPTLRGLGVGLKGVASAFRQAMLSGDGFKGILRTLFADSMSVKLAMTAMGVAIKGALAFTIMAFARSDFGGQLFGSFQKAERKIVAGLQNIGNEFKKLNKEIKGTKKELETIKLPSKGLQLDPRVIFGMSDSKGFTTDDLFTQWNKNAALTNNELKRAKAFKQEADKLGLGNYFSGQEKFLTIAQTDLLRSAQELKSQNKDLVKYLQEINLSPKTLLNNLDPVLSDINKIDQKRQELLQQRSVLGLENTSDAKNKIGEIDSQVRELDKKRREAVKPLASVLSDFFDVKEMFNKQSDAINQSDLPASAKRALMALLQPQLDIINNIESVIKQAKLEDLIKPIESAWAEVYDRLTDVEKLTDRTLHKTFLMGAQQQVDIYQTSNSPYELQSRLNAQNYQQLIEERQQITKLLEERKRSLAELLSIPEVETNENKKQDIEELRNNIRQDEQNLAQRSVAIAKLENDFQQEQINRRKSLEAFLKTTIDFNRTVEDFYREAERQIIDFQRSVYDYEFSIDQFNIDQSRSLRGIQESYNDLYLSIEQQTLAAENQIRETIRQINRIELENRLADINPLGIENPFQGALDSIQGISDALDAFESATDQQTETRLSVEQETLNIARQIRSLQEQQEDMERQRNQAIRQFQIQAEQLQRQQEDFNRNQKRQWDDILYQASQIAQQAYELGVVMNDVGLGLAEQGEGLIKVIRSLADGIQAIEINSASTSSDFQSFVSGVVAETGGAVNQDPYTRGRSTGPHLHAQSVTGNLSESQIRSIMDEYVRVDGKKPSSFGESRASAGHGYTAIDYKTPQGGDITLLGGARLELYRSGGGNGGLMAKLITPKGTLELGHLLSLDVSQNGTTSNTQQATSNTQQAAVNPNSGLVPTGMSPQEYEKLLRMAVAEAGGEGITGMALVINSIFNRQAMILEGKAKASDYYAKSSSITDIIEAVGPNGAQYSPFGQRNSKYHKGITDAERKQAEMAFRMAHFDALNQQLTAEGYNQQKRIALISATGFRTHTAKNDSSQNHNIASYGGHRFNADRFSQNVNLRQLRIDANTPVASSNRPQPVTVTNVEDFPDPVNINATNVNQQAKKIPSNKTALTFDDGIDPTWTPQVLDELKKHGMKATFFVVGQRAEQYPEILKRMVDEGHEVGIHSWSHPDFTKITKEQRKQEVERTRQLIKNTTGYDPTLVRFPYGQGSYQGQESFQKEMNELGLSTVFWSGKDIRDWHKDTTAKDIEQGILELGGGDIILLHDALDVKGLPNTATTRQPLIDALKVALPELQRRGIQSETLGSLYGTSMPRQQTTSQGSIVDQPTSQRSTVELPPVRTISIPNNPPQFNGQLLTETIQDPNSLITPLTFDSPDMSAIEAERQRQIEKQQQIQAEEARKQLESQLNRSNRQLQSDQFNIGGQNIQILRGMEDFARKWRDITINAKGYLTITERITKAGEDAAQPFRELSRELEDSIRTNEQVLNVGLNVQKLEDFYTQIERIKNSTELTSEQQAEYISKIEELIKLYQSGEFEDHLKLKQEELELNKANKEIIDAQIESESKLAEQRKQLEEQFNLSQGLFNAENEALQAEQRLKGGSGLFDRARYEQIMFENSDDAIQNRLRNDAERLGISPNTQDYRDLADSLERIQQANIANAFYEASPALQQFEDALVGVLTGTQSLGDAFKALFMTIATEIIKMTLIRPVINALGGLFSGLFGFSGGVAQPLLSNSVAQGLFFPAFADGGSVQDALRKERVATGNKPVLAVLNDKEYVVSAKDGRLFEDYKMMRKMNSLNLEYQAVKNYNQGGYVNPNYSRNNQSQSSGMTYIVNSNNNISVQSPTLVGESLTQIENRQNEQLQRANRRFG